MQSRSMLFRVLRGNKSIRTTHISTVLKDSSSAHDTRPCDNVLSFESIPGPRPLPLIGTALDYSPIRGFDVKRVHDLWAKRHDDYGDIFKERIPGGSYNVFCRSKEDTERLFRMEGRLPFRMILNSIDTIKRVMDHPTSVVNAKGESWLQLRQPINKLLLRKPTTWKHTKVQQDVCREAVEYIKKNRDDKLEVPGLADLTQRWAMEMAGTFALNCRLGLLRQDVSPEMIEMFDGTRKMMALIAAESTGSYWKFKASIGLKASIRRTKQILSSLIDKHRESGDLNGTLFQGIMDIENMSQIEKESILFDLLLAAVETTSNTISLCLYCIATSERVQHKLREEITALTQEQRSSGRAIDGLVYMNAFLKEAHRLLPFTHALVRSFDHDVVLSGYRVPAGIRIVNTINSSYNKNERYFKNPDECLPERWLDKSTPQFTSSGAFGMGARACPGRFLAKQELVLLLMEILSQFEVQYWHEPATSVNQGTGILSTDPRFSFVSLKI